MREEKITVTSETLDEIDKFWKNYNIDIPGLPTRFGNLDAPYNTRLREMVRYASEHLAHEQVPQQMLNEMDSLNLDNNFWYWDSGGIGQEPQTDSEKEKWYRNRMPADFVGTLKQLSDYAQAVRTNADMDDVKEKYPFMSNMTKERYLTLTNLFAELDHICDVTDDAYTAWYGEYD